MRQTHSLYTRQRMHKLPLHTELINLIGLAFHGKLYWGILSKEDFIWRDCLSYQSDLRPSVLCVVKLPNNLVSLIREWQTNSQLLVRYSGHFWNNGPFAHRTNLDHLNTGLVRYSDPHYPLGIWNPSEFWMAKRGWFVSGPVFEWDLKSGSLIIWNLDKWPPLLSEIIWNLDKIILILNGLVLKW